MTKTVSLSPLLAHIYLHYVLDLWAQWWRTPRPRGEVYIVRYVDDFVMGFHYPSKKRRAQADAWALRFFIDAFHAAHRLRLPVPLTSLVGA